MSWSSKKVKTSISQRAFVQRQKWQILLHVFLWRRDLFDQLSCNKDWIWSKCTSSCPRHRILLWVTAHTIKGGRWKTEQYVKSTSINLIRILIIDAPLIEAVSAYGLFLSDDKLLASDTDVALTAPEVSQMPAFVHCYCVLTSEDQLNGKGEKQTVITYCIISQKSRQYPTLHGVLYSRL